MDGGGPRGDAAPPRPDATVDTAPDGHGVTEASRGDAGAGYPDSGHPDVEAGAPASNAAADADHACGDATSPACQCAYPSLGVQGLDASTAPYVFSRLWSLERELLDVAKQAPQLLADLIAGTPPPCGTATYDGTPGAYESGRIATFALGNCDGGAAVERFEVTILEPYALTTPPGQVFDRAYAGKVKVVYTGFRTLPTGESLLIAGPFLLTYSSGVRGQVRPSTTIHDDARTLEADPASPPMTVGDGAGHTLSLTLGKVEEVGAFYFGSSDDVRSRSFAYTLTDSATSNALTVQTPTALTEVTPRSRMVDGEQAVVDADGTHAALAIHYQLGLVDEATVTLSKSSDAGGAVALPAMSFASLEAGLAWPAGPSSCAVGPWWPSR